jgi:hypothetical protein
MGIADDIQAWQGLMCFITKLPKRRRALYRRGPLVIQHLMSARGFEVPPDILALDCNQQFCGVFDGYGPAMSQGATMALRGPMGTQWILVTLAIAQQSRTRIGTPLTVRRGHDGRYEVKPRRARARCSVIHRRQVIVDEHAQRAQVASALCDSIESA